MLVDQLIGQGTILLSKYSAVYLLPVMIGVFAIGTILKMFIYYTSKTLFTLSGEVEKRIHYYIDGGFPELKGLDFPSLTKAILDKTFHEYFFMRKKNMRRKLDATTSFLDRMFYLDSGAQNLFQDTTKMASYHKDTNEPDFRSMTSFAFSANPYFNHLFGLIPFRIVNDVLTILPGLFIVGGIFGTFLGIVHGIPGLKGIDPSNIDATKKTLDFFLDQMAYSMNTSVVGIFLSVFFTLVNTLFSPKSLQTEAFVKYGHCLEFIWRQANSDGHHAQSFKENEKHHDQKPPSSGGELLLVPDVIQASTHDEHPPVDVPLDLDELDKLKSAV